MRPPDILLILLSIAIILLAGLSPLFGMHDRVATIAQECNMFYGPSGPDAVARCMTEMGRHPPAGTAR